MFNACGPIPYKTKNASGLNHKIWSIYLVNPPHNPFMTLLQCRIIRLKNIGFLVSFKKKKKKKKKGKKERKKKKKKEENYILILPVN